VREVLVSWRAWHEVQSSDPSGVGDLAGNEVYCSQGNSKCMKGSVIVQVVARATLRSARWRLWGARAVCL
jgi:hypothetical protein